MADVTFKACADYSYVRTTPPPPAGTRHGDLGIQIFNDKTVALHLNELLLEFITQSSKIRPH